MTTTNRLKVLDAFPEHLLEALPVLNQHGVLPSGDYAPTRTDFEDRFVNSGDSTIRKLIYDGWNLHKQSLIQDGLAESAWQLLNGSFTTSKNAPGDIDIAVEVPVDGDTLERLHASSPIVRLLQGSNMKEKYKCDAYPIYSLPISHKNYQAVTVEAIRYWTKWFGQTRQGIPKGRVWAKVGGLR